MASAASIGVAHFWWCRSCQSAWPWKSAVGLPDMALCPSCAARIRPLRPVRSQGTQRPGLLTSEDVARTPEGFSDTGAGYPLGVGMPRGGPVSWARILKRDPCAYCGARSTSIDHIVPADPRVPAPPFGKSGWLNYAGACSRCNSEKASKSLLWFLLER